MEIFHTEHALYSILTLWQIILPESGMMDFCVASCFVCQSSTASIGSGIVGKLTVVKTEGICKNECCKLLIKHYFTEWKAQTTAVWPNSFSVIG